MFALATSSPRTGSTRYVRWFMTRGSAAKLDFDFKQRHAKKFDPSRLDSECGLHPCLEPLYMCWPFAV